MATKPLDDEVLIGSLVALEEHGTIAETSRALKIPRSTPEHRLRLARDRELTVRDAETQNVELPHFQEAGDIPVEEILDIMERRFDKRLAQFKEQDWYEVKIKGDLKPICLHFLGDPHIDSGNCRIGELRSDLSKMQNPGPNGEDTGHLVCNLGDTTDGDWPGRLARLHAKSDTSLDTARRLARWLLTESGVKYACWIMGNHDLWGADADLLRAHNTHRIPMSDWGARWQIVFPNGKRCRIVTAHDFSGRSIWNTLHSAGKAALMTVDANIWACGHTHQAAIHQEEHQHRKFVYWLIRAKGYKYGALDEYAKRLGHMGQEHGSTISAVIDPTAEDDIRFVQCFASGAEAAEYLAWKRSR